MSSASASSAKSNPTRLKSSFSSTTGPDSMGNPSPVALSTCSFLMRVESKALRHRGQLLGCVDLRQLRSPIFQLRICRPNHQQIRSTTGENDGQCARLRRRGEYALVAENMAALDRMRGFGGRGPVVRVQADVALGRRMDDEHRCSLALQGRVCGGENVVDNSRGR